MSESVTNMCKDDAVTIVGGPHGRRPGHRVQAPLSHPCSIYGDPAGSPAVERRNRTTVNNGYLGSRNDEERSEMRYVMRIAEFSESSNL